MPKITKNTNKVHPSITHGLHHSPDHHHHHLLALLLPAAILSLTATLSPDETEVLAYLISSHSNGNSSANKKSDTISDRYDGGGGHVPVFSCNCFRCYTSFWSRWDKSPKRDLIHEIIEAYEEGLSHSRQKSTKVKKKKKKKNCKISDNKKTATERVEGGGNGSGTPVAPDGDGVGVGIVGLPGKGLEKTGFREKNSREKSNPLERVFFAHTQEVFSIMKKMRELYLDHIK
ncbi:hypothetical protein SAY87_025336 [Trapa incisa]|uniref:Uncharacterized protein n=1 Tax=Trapa incisa TaxID=236973 RepID=A0AAN7GDH0_9MYRT|nr:hypothetical protein SAY87_025336 [Trapa incisa]